MKGEKFNEKFKVGMEKPGGREGDEVVAETEMVVAVKAMEGSGSCCGREEVGTGRENGGGDGDGGGGDGAADEPGGRETVVAETEMVVAVKAMRREVDLKWR